MKILKGKKKWTANTWQLLSLAMLGVVFLLVFAYAPMYGIVLAFTNGDYQLDILVAMFNSGSAGFENFKVFLSDPEFLNVMLNTLGLNILQLLINFPAPIIFALILNEVSLRKYRKVVQTVSYFPYFISWIVFGGIMLALLDPQTGILNATLIKLKIVDNPINFGLPQYFWGTIIITSLLKGLGWGSIIYFAAIAGIDQQLYEAAKIDGSNRWQNCIYITLPSIVPTITLFFILSVSGILNNGFDHIYVFQNQQNLSSSEVIDTFVYKYGIVNLRYSYTTAVGLFKSILALILLSGAHLVSKKLTGRGAF